jgi:diguanylate cyclase (GGDEF)-like protein
MSSAISSLEDAADHILGTLKHFLQLDTLVVVASNRTESNILKAFKRHNCSIHDSTKLALLQSYCSLVLTHNEPILTIPNTHEDPRTAILPITQQIEACSFIGIAVKTSDHEPVGVICALDPKPLHLNEQQLALLHSMAAFFSYISDLENASVTDSLTGLYNRRYLSHMYRSPEDKQFSVMFIDIDDFKEVNDSLGHDIGDLLLFQIAERLKQSVRKSDILIRYGGDEFVICFQHLVDQDIEIVKNKIKDSIEQPFTINGHTINISASIGISYSRGSGNSLKELISNADHAMYDVKQCEKSLP